MLCCWVALNMHHVSPLSVRDCSSQHNTAFIESLISHNDKHLGAKHSHWRWFTLALPSICCSRILDSSLNQTVYHRKGHTLWVWHHWGCHGDAVLLEQPHWSEILCKPVTVWCRFMNWSCAAVVTSGLLCLHRPTMVLSSW